MSFKRIEFNFKIPYYGGAKIIGKILQVEYDKKDKWHTIAGMNAIGKKINKETKNDIIEFVLPENHNQSIDFADNFTVYYKEVNGKNYLIEVDAYYENDELMKLDEKILGYPITWNKKIDFMSDSQINEMLIKEWHNDDFKFTFNKNNSLSILKKDNNQDYSGIFKLKNGRIAYKCGEEQEFLIDGYLIHISDKVLSYYYKSNKDVEMVILFNLKA